MRPRQYQDGEKIYELGGIGKELYLIESGSVNVCNYSESGRELKIAELQVGDCFGEMSLLDGLPRANSAYSTGVTGLLVLKSDDFWVAYQRFPQIGLEINRLLCRRLRMTYLLAQEASVLTLRDRLVRLVCRLGFSAGVNGTGGNTVLKGVSHDQLARLLGTSRQSVSRELKILENMALLECSYGRIIIRDIDALAAASDTLIGDEPMVPDYHGLLNTRD